MGIATKYYVDVSGNYLGGFSEGNPVIPEGSIEIPSPPDHGWQKWGGSKWLPLTPEQIATING